MRLIILLELLLSIFFFSCKKKCNDAGHYVIPVMVSISDGERFTVNKDTIRVKIEIPFKAKDIRDSAALFIKNYPQSNLFVGLSFLPKRIESVDLRPLLLIKDGYFEKIDEIGRSLKKDGLQYAYSPQEESWEISFSLIPKKYLEGVICISMGITNFKNDCLLIQPAYVFDNPSKNWHLLDTQLDHSINPWTNDYYFYLKP